MGLLSRYDVVLDERTRTATYDDGTYDYVEVRNEGGLLEQRPVAATDEELRQTEIRNLNANLALVEEALLHVDGSFVTEDLLPTERHERIEERRAGLEAERAVIEARLKILEATPAEPKRRGK